MLFNVMSGSVFFHTDNQSKVSVKIKGETVWLTQKQLSEILDTSIDNIGLHLKNIYSTDELQEEATTEDFSVVQTEGKRSVTRKIKHYNLDAVISVAYRVNSKKGTLFRQWATTILRDHLVHGWTLDQKRFERNAIELESALKLVKKTIDSKEITTDTAKGFVEIISQFAQTFVLLQRYDEGLLTKPKGTNGGIIPSIREARSLISGLKKTLIERGEASNLFGIERDNGISAIIGSLNQSVFGEPAYKTVETKAAHLLYFTIKNHPLSDGNKRTAALLFIDFLNRNNALIQNGKPIINDVGLAALALLVAESDPKQKDTMIRLIENMLSTKDS